MKSQNKNQNLKGSAYVIMLSLKTNKRIATIDPQHVNLDGEKIDFLRGNRTDVRVTLQVYPQVVRTAAQLAIRKQEAIAAVSGIQIGAGLALIPASNISEWDDQLETLEQEFLVRGKELRDGWEDAFAAFRNQVLSNLISTGNSQEQAERLWHEFYRKKFYDPTDFDPENFGIFEFFREMVDPSSKSGARQIADAKDSLMAELRNLADSVQKLKECNPLDGRIRPEKRLEQIEDLRSKMEWLDSLIKSRTERVYRDLDTLQSQVLALTAA